MKVFHFDPEVPEADLWQLEEVAGLVGREALGVVPTDTFYAFACDVESQVAARRLYDVKGLAPKKPLSILCADLSMAGPYVRGVPTTYYRAMRRVLPGPYTFVVPAGDALPRVMLRTRKTIGIRVPDDLVCRTLVERFGRPLLCTSVRVESDAVLTDPWEIGQRFERQIDLLVDGGVRPAEPSTVIDLTGPEPVLLREGKGPVDAFL